MVKNFFSKYFPFIWFTVVPIVSSILIGYFSLDLLIDQELTIVFIILLYSALSVMMGLAMIPTTFVAIFTGFIGGWKLLPVMIFGYILASLLGYLVGQKTDKEYWLSIINRFQRGKDLLRNVGEKSNLFVFSCRLSPVLPFGITNVALSIIGIPLKRFLTFGTLGMLPRTILAVWLGVEAEDFASAMTEGKDLPIFQLTTVLLIFVSTALIIKVFFKRSQI